MKQHTLWVEKYRPSTLENYISNDPIKERMEHIIKSNDIPNLLLIGAPGIGKTTLAKIIVNNTKCDYLYLNASDENGIEMIREKVKGFASSSSFNPLKVIILDEADFLTQPAQAALRNLIEEYSLSTRFILTCNYVEKIIEPLQSRCEIHKLESPSKGVIARHISSLLIKEKIAFDNKDLVQLINNYYPDIRSILIKTQSLIKDSKFVWSEKDNNWLIKLVETLKKRDNRAWYDIRQLVANSEIVDFQTAYRHLFDKLEEFSNGHDAEISIILDEFSWRANVVPDKEINFAAAIAKILETIK